MKNTYLSAVQAQPGSNTTWWGLSVAVSPEKRSQSAFHRLNLTESEGKRSGMKIYDV